ncbi:MAG: hypothetical protein ACE15E_14625 [Acidobacteriota bacterium]
MSRQSGEGKLGCVVTLALMVVFLFICFRSIPVLIDKMDFEDQLERIASEGGSRGLDADVVRSQIAELVRNKQFETTPESIQVMKSAGKGGDLRISVNYWRTVSFVVYTYTFRFRSEAKSFIGTL